MLSNSSNKLLLETTATGVPRICRSFVVYRTLSENLRIRNESYVQTYRFLQESFPLGYAIDGTETDANHGYDNSEEETNSTLQGETEEWNTSRQPPRMVGTYFDCYSNGRPRFRKYPFIQGLIPLSKENFHHPVLVPTCTKAFRQLACWYIK